MEREGGRERERGGTLGNIEKKGKEQERGGSDRHRVRYKEQRPKRQTQRKVKKEERVT